MNSNQRSKENNQTDNMANEKSVSSSRGGTTENYSKQSGSEGTGQPGGGSKQSGTRQSQGATGGSSQQSQADLAGGSQQSTGRGHKAQESLDRDAAQDWQGAEQSQRGGGSQQSQRGSGSRQSQASPGQQPLADGLSQQPQDRPDLKTGGQSKGGSTLYGTGQGQHAQSSGGHEGADTRVVKEGAGMPAQGDVGRSAQTGRSGSGLEGAGQSAGTRETGHQNAQRDSSAGSSQLSGSTDSANTDSTGRAGSQTGNQQLGNEQIDDVGNQRYSNDSAGGMPRSPGGSRMSAEQDMNDDTGLSNKANRQEIDMGTKQEQQSNVGRRSDMTPD